MAGFFAAQLGIETRLWLTVFLMVDLNEQAKTVFYQVVDIADQAERSRLVDSLCEGDSALRNQVMELLAAHESVDALRSPAPDVAAMRVDFGDYGVGKKIDRYKLLEVIGEGGFGVVYLAQQLKPIQRRIALKVIKAGMDTKEVVGRFEAERQALALMDHPNIAKVIDAGATNEGRPFFVMELVRGEPITDFCDQYGLTTEEKLRLFMDVCSAVQHAHQKGIIHRDIKPSNVLVARDGERPVAKVIDFGIAKAMQGRLTDKTLFTQFRQFMGTPAYMSPEQAQMTAIDVDTRSDIYSLGVLLYELLTGTTPFDSKRLLEAGVEEMCRTIRNVEPAPPSTRLRRCPSDGTLSPGMFRDIDRIELERQVRGELDWIVMKAIDKDRMRRYESADAFRQDLHRFLNNEAVLAAAPGVSYRVGKFIQRNQKAIVATSLIGLLLFSGTIISTWQALRATRQTTRAVVAEQAALKNLTLAEENEIAARRSQYAAEMMLLQSSVRGLSSEKVYELLKRQIPKHGEQDYRGFEWRWLWNNNHGRELFALEGHKADICDVAMSPDGRWLASGSIDGTARLWDLSARRQVWMWSGGESCNHVAFSPDGRDLVTSWSEGNGKRLNIMWDVVDPTQPKKVRNIESFGGFSPDGETAISGWTGFNGAKTLYQFKLETGEVLHEFSDPAFAGTKFAGQPHRTARWTTTFSADGQQLLTVGHDQTVKVWNTEDGSLKIQIDSDSELFDGALSPVDETIATVSVDVGLLQIWNAQGEELRRLKYDNPLDRIRYSTDGKKLIASERFGRIHVYDTSTFEELTSFDSRGSFLALQLSSPIDSNVVVTAAEISLTNAIRIWDIASNETVLDHVGPVRALSFSHNGAMLAVGMVNGAVQLWDVATRSPIFATPETRLVDPDLRVPPGLTSYRPGFVQFSPNDEKMAVIGLQTAITVWDIDSQQPEVVIEPPTETGRFYAMTFSPSGEELYAGTMAGADSPGFYQWKLSEPTKPVMAFQQPGAFGVGSFAWSTDGVLASSRTEEVMLWKPPSQKSVRKLDMSMLPPQRRGALNLEFSPCGNWLAAGTPAASVWLWNTNDWKLETLPLVSEVTSVDFSPNGKRLAAADMWSVVKLWDVESRQPVATFKGSTAEFSPDGTILAIGCETHLGSLKMPEAGRVRLYHAPKLSELDAD